MRVVAAQARKALSDRSCRDAPELLRGPRRLAVEPLLLAGLRVQPADRLVAAAAGSDQHPVAERSVDLRFAARGQCLFHVSSLNGEYDESQHRPAPCRRQENKNNRHATVIFGRAGGT